MRATLATLLVLAAATTASASLPTAQASEPEADPCDGSDVLDVTYYATRGDDVVELDDMTGNLQQGDVLDIRVNATLDCVGATLYAISFVDDSDDDSPDGPDEWQMPWHGDVALLTPEPDTEIATARLGLEIPPCHFDAYLVLWTGEVLDHDSGGEDACADVIEAPDCPEDLTATANDDGTVTLAWSPSEGALGYAIYRAEAGSDEWILVDVVFEGETTVTDETTAVGVAYTYKVTAFDEDAESQGCATVDVTAVPFLGAPLLGALALVGAVGAFAWMGRRPAPPR